MSNSTLKGSTLVTFIIGLIVLIAIVLLFGSCDSPSARRAREWKSSHSVSTAIMPNHNRGTIVLANDTVQVISADKEDTITVIVGPYAYDVYSTEDYTVIDHVKR